jgi:hypothetical protein
MNKVDTLDEVKKEVEAILVRYEIPMDDRMLISEKIERAVEGAISRQNAFYEGQIDQVRNQISRERKAVLGKVKGIHADAISKTNLAVGKVQQAYDKGVDDGLSQAKKDTSPSTFQVLIGLGLLALAGVVVFGGLFKKA